MTARIRFHEAARDEYLSAAKRYEEARPGLGADFQAEVDMHADQAASGRLPGTAASSLHGHDIRKLPLDRFPYILHFERRGDDLIVWAVAHTKRRPGTGGAAADDINRVGERLDVSGKGSDAS